MSRSVPGGKVRFWENSMLQDMKQRYLMETVLAQGISDEMSSV